MPDDTAHTAPCDLKRRLLCHSLLATANAATGPAVAVGTAVGGEEQCPVLRLCADVHVHIRACKRYITLTLLWHGAAAVQLERGDNVHAAGPARSALAKPAQDTGARLQRWRNSVRCKLLRALTCKAVACTSGLFQMLAAFSVTRFGALPAAP